MPQNPALRRRLPTKADQDGEKIPDTNEDEGDEANFAEVIEESTDEEEDEEDTMTVEKLTPQVGLYYSELRGKIAEIIESFEVQLGIIVLIALDVTASVLLLLSQLGVENSPIKPTSIWAEALQRFSGFSIFFFMLELALLVFAGGANFFSHYGYGLDVLIVSYLFYADLSGISKVVRILGLLRFWRPFRLVNTMLAAAEARIDDVVKQLEAEKARVHEAKAETRREQEALRLEKEVRRQVETMLSAYKDEVETLTEALNIAATAVAQEKLAGMSEYSDPEDLTSALLSDIEETLDSIPEEGEVYTHPTKAPAGHRLVVKEDGTFEPVGPETAPPPGS